MVLQDGALCQKSSGWISVHLSGSGSRDPNVFPKLLIARPPLRNRLDLGQSTGKSVFFCVSGWVMATKQILPFQCTSLNFKSLKRANTYALHGLKAAQGRPKDREKYWHSSSVAALDSFSWFCIRYVYITFSVIFQLCLGFDTPHVEIYWVISICAERTSISWCCQEKWSKITNEALWAIHIELLLFCSNAASCFPCASSLPCAKIYYYKYPCK